MEKKASGDAGSGHRKARRPSKGCQGLWASASSNLERERERGKGKEKEREEGGGEAAEWQKRSPRSHGFEIGATLPLFHGYF